MFHRHLYLENGKVYIKLLKVNNKIKNLDVLILYDTKSYVLKIYTANYTFAVGGTTSKGVAVLGELFSRYLTQKSI